MCVDSNGVGESLFNITVYLRIKDCSGMHAVVFTWFLNIIRLLIFKGYFRVILLVEIRIYRVCTTFFNHHKKADDITLLIYIFLVFL